MTARSGASGLYGFGIVLVVAGVVILLLVLLDYLQDRKADVGLVVVGGLVIATGTCLYLAGRSRKARDR
ncbi:MAG TPA: hypothetical protein VF263_26685 [Longimicrobiaceae bacterium]